MTPLEKELFDKIDEAVNRIMQITNQTTVYDLAMLVIRVICKR